MNKEIQLEEYEEICPECNGETCKEYHREISTIDFMFHNQMIKIPGLIIDETKDFCFRCMGTGKISWIDKIMGNKNGKD